MEIDGSDNINIFRNLFHDNYINNASIAIYLNNAATNIRVFNNTFYNNCCGIYLDNTSKIKITNNIFLNHQGTGQPYSGYALYNTGGAAGNETYDYNDFWNNLHNTNSVGSFITGQSNHYASPVIDTTISFTIQSPTSICVDHAKVVTNVSYPYNGNGPDIGWKESGFTYIPSFNVVYVSHPVRWTNSITNALKIASNNCIIVCHHDAGPFFESPRIVNFTNLIIRSFDWTNASAHNNTTTIVDGAQRSRVFTLSNSKNITIQGFTIRNATNGIYLNTGISNRILDNMIVDHFLSGIVITSNNANNNIISSNNFYYDGVGPGNQQFGILMYKTKYNLIYTNQIYNNVNTGIFLTGLCKSNLIRQNNVHANQQFGIQMDYGNYNTIYNNSIFDQPNSGIYISVIASTNKIIKNTIYSNNFGIYINRW